MKSEAQRTYDRRRDAASARYNDHGTTSPGLTLNPEQAHRMLLSLLEFRAALNAEGHGRVPRRVRNSAYRLLGHLRAWEDDAVYCLDHFRFPDQERGPNPDKPPRYGMNR